MRPDTHIPENEPLTGDFDGKPIDYAFLSLFEHARAESIQKQIAVVKEQVQELAPSHIPPQNLTSLVVHYGNTVLPRPHGAPKQGPSLIATPTTLQNLESLPKVASAFLSDPGDSFVLLTLPLSSAPRRRPQQLAHERKR